MPSPLLVATALMDIFVIFEIEPKAKFKKTFWPFLATTLYAIVILVIMFVVKFTKAIENIEGIDKDRIIAFGGTGPSNQAIMVINLTPWSERKINPINFAIAIFIAASVPV